jgi:F-type H+-transporting ATPase subunit b
MATETVEHTADAGGLPQLDFASFPNQIFWLVIALIAIFFVLSRIALPRIGAILAERSGTITNDLAAAEELTQKAVEAEAAYEKALAEARTEANQIVEKAKADIQAELGVELAKADEKIAAKAAESEAAIAEIRKGAVKSVTAVAKSAAKDIVSVMGGTADAKTITAAVTARMKG